MTSLQSVGSYFRNLANAVTGRSVPSGVTAGSIGFGAGGPIFLDAFHSKRPPSPYELVNSWKSIVYSCTRLNMHGVARTPLKLYARTSPKQRRPRRTYSRVISTRTERYIRSQPNLARTLNEDDAIDEIKEHPFLEALDKPNPYFDGNLLIHHIVASMDVVGTAYLFPTRPLGPDGNPDVTQAREGMEIWPFQSQYVFPFKGMSPDGLIREYRYFGDSYSPDSLIRIRYISLRDPYMSAYSPLHACFEQQGLTDYYKAIVESILKSGARPALMVSPADAAVPFGEQERRRLEQDINNRFTGGRSGHVWVNNSALKVEPISYTPADLAGLTISKDMRLEIANCLDIPISMLQSEDSNRAVSQEGTHQHQYYAIEPRCRAIASALTQQWAQPVDDRLFFCFDDPVARDDERDAKVVGLKVADGRMTINEAREEHGLGPVDWGEEPWLPQTLIQPTQQQQNHQMALKQQFESHELGKQAQEQGLQQGADKHEMGKETHEMGKEAHGMNMKKTAFDMEKDNEDRANEEKGKARSESIEEEGWARIVRTLDAYEQELRFNPNHNPHDGRFDFGHGGKSSGGSGGGGSEEVKKTKEFDPEDPWEMGEFLKESFGKHTESLSAEQTSAIKDYTRNSFKEINSSLREGKTHPAVDALDSAIKSGKVSEDLTVYRYVKGAKEAGFHGERSVGGEYTDLGYTSTSLNKKVGRFSDLSVKDVVSQDYALLKIKIPKGSNAAVGDLTEQELILPRGSSFKIKSFTKPYTERIYDVELVR